MNFSQIKSEILKIINRTDLDDSYLSNVVNEAIEFIDRLSLWFFEEKVYTINVNGRNYVLQYDLILNRIKSIKKIYYNLVDSQTTFLNLIPVSSIDEAIMLIGNCNTSNDVFQIRNNLFGGFYYIEEGKIKTYPEILVNVDTLYLNVFTYLDRLFRDFDTNYLTDNYPSLIINYALSKIYRDYEVYDVAEEYKKVFEDELKGLYFVNLSIYKEVNPNELFRTTTENNK
jgi:hypothetical protein